MDCPHCQAPIADGGTSCPNCLGREIPIKPAMRSLGAPIDLFALMGPTFAVIAWALTRLQYNYDGMKLPMVAALFFGPMAVGFGLLTLLRRRRGVLPIALAVLSMALGSPFLYDLWDS